MDGTSRAARMRADLDRMKVLFHLRREYVASGFSRTSSGPTKGGHYAQRECDYATRALHRALRLMAIRIECVLECGNHLGEGPVWDVEDGCLYWVDGTGRRVGNPSIWRMDPRTGKTRTWSLAHDVGAMALRRNGGAVLALADGFYFFDFDSGT